jgi:hypothetical protein
VDLFRNFLYSAGQPNAHLYNEAVRICENEYLSGLPWVTKLTHPKESIQEKYAYIYKKLFNRVF